MSHQYFVNPYKEVARPFVKDLGGKTKMNMDLAVKLNETGQVQPWFGLNSLANRLREPPESSRMSFRTGRDHNPLQTLAQFHLILPSCHDGHESGPQP